VYHCFFKLSEEPFGVTPDPRFFFASSQHTEAAASIYYSVVQRRGFAALIAAPGLGKTSIIVSLLPRVRERADVVLLVHPQLDGEALVESVLQGLGISPHTEPAKRAQQVADHLIELDRRGRSCVIILDEAQNLSFEALESVRMLSNYEMPGRKLVQFILVGQPALGTLLLRAECEQIRQRINIIARLQPLTAEYVAAYIQARIKTAGGTRNPFTGDAVAAIAAASGGIPRIVNTLCFNALTLAFADSSTVVNKSHVAEVIADLRLEIPVAAKKLAFTPAEALPPFQLHYGFLDKVGVHAARNWRSFTRALGIQPQRSNLS
jgi:general secretion pathway protein A